MSKLISVVIVSYNSQDFIEKCVSSVLLNLPNSGETLILDNASTDGTVKELEKFLPNIKLIKSDENLGFAKGCNKAAKEAFGEYLFFLNPDTEMGKSVLEELINFYKRTPVVGIVGPKLILPDGRVQPTVRKLPTIWGAIKEYIFGEKNAYNQYAPLGDEPQEVEMIYGAAMLIKRDLFIKLGGFNEKYFLYYEDADLCKKVRNFGKKIYYYPKVSVRHLVGGTKTDLDKNELNYQSSVMYHGILGTLTLQLIFLISRLRRYF